nr:nitroreductase family deazaflavin-dependent oxidoreductase [Mycobacteroides immunogenum]
MQVMTDLNDPAAFHDNVMAQIRETGGADGVFAQFDMLILHTVGAKSGQPRQNPMAYQPGGDDGEFYVFASNNGRDTSSAWYYNALAHPDRVEVEIGSDRYRVAVRDVVGEQRDRIYARQAERFENFAEYERKTTRVIPVLGLTRVD